MNTPFDAECVPPILTLTFQGEEAEIRNLATVREKVRNELRLHSGCCDIYLIDIRGFRGRPDIVELVKIAERIPSDIKSNPVFIVDLPEHASLARQSETILRNRMVNVRYFTDMQEAKAKAEYLGELRKKK